MNAYSNEDLSKEFGKSKYTLNLKEHKKKHTGGGGEDHGYD